MKNKILIADDHFIIRAGINILIETNLENYSVSVAENYYEVIEKINNEVFELLILDINMEGSKNEMMITEIKAIQPDIKIMMFSTSDEKVGLLYISKGANGFLNKLSKETEMIHAIKTILETGSYYPQRLMLSAMENISNHNSNNPLKELSEREYEIFLLLVDGNGNLEISNLLKIHTSTISTYKKRIYSKLNANNIVELINIHQKFKIS